MGRQIHFYMMPEDQRSFLQMVKQRDPVTVCFRDADSPDIREVSEDAISGRTLCLWNQKLIPNLKRQWIPNPGYFRIDGLTTPTLEFVPSFIATWRGRPALGQGRLFGDFNQHLSKPPAFIKWYEALVRWLRNHSHKNSGGPGGYVAPLAFEFYKTGGLLLPNFVPPETDEWIAAIDRAGGPRQVGGSRKSS